MSLRTNPITIIIIGPNILITNTANAKKIAKNINNIKVIISSPPFIIGDVTFAKTNRRLLIPPIWNKSKCVYYLFK